MFVYHITLWKLAESINSVYLIYGKALCWKAESLDASRAACLWFVMRCLLCLFSSQKHQPGGGSDTAGGVTVSAEKTPISGED